MKFTECNAVEVAVLKKLAHMDQPKTSDIR